MYCQFYNHTATYYIIEHRLWCYPSWSIKNSLQSCVVLKDRCKCMKKCLPTTVPLSAASLRVVQEEFGSAALILVCEATENSEHAEHTWLFQGKPLPPPPMFSTQSGGARLTLNPTAADPWDIIGAVQCRVENVAGSVSVATQVRFAGKY